MIKIIMFRRLFIKRIKPTELGRWNYQAPMVKADLANCDSCGSCGLENIYLAQKNKKNNVIKKHFENHSDKINEEAKIINENNEKSKVS